MKHLKSFRIFESVTSITPEDAENQLEKYKKKHGVKGRWPLMTLKSGFKLSVQPWEHHGWDGWSIMVDENNLQKLDDTLREETKKTLEQKCPGGVDISREGNKVIYEFGYDHEQDCGCCKTVLDIIALHGGIDS